MAYLVKPFTKADLVPAIEIAASRFRETSALESEVATLKDRLEVRKILDRAKGKLQAEHGLTEPEAFRWIQKTSMDQRLAMRAVAEKLLDGAMAPNSGTAGAQPAADGSAAKKSEAAKGGEAAKGSEAAEGTPEAKATEA
jgi:response regulator NasT